MNRLLIILIVAFATRVLADDPPAFMSSTEAQRLVDTAIDEADKIVVVHEWMPWARPDKRGAVPLLVLQSESRDEILALSRFIRIRMPEPEREIIDGKEQWFIAQTKIDCNERFEVTLSKKGATLLTFSMFGGGGHISCGRLMEDSVVEIDDRASAPLLRKLHQAVEQKEGEPGATDNPDDAQRLREDH